MGLTRAGQHPVNNILTQFAREGMDQVYLVDQGVLPQIIVPEISGTWIAPDPKGYAGAAQISLARASGAPRATAETNDPLTDTFNIRDFGFELKHDLRIDPITDQLGDLSVELASQAANVVKVAMELRLRDTLVGAASGWSTSFASSGNLTSGTQWGTAGAQPLTDLNTLCHTTFPEQAWGEAPNTMVIARDVAVVLNADAEIRGYLPGLGSSTGVGSKVMSSAGNFAMLREVVGMVCGIDPNRVFIGKFISNTANTAQAGVQTPIWADTVWIGKVDLGGPRSPSTGNRIFLSPTAAVDFSAYAFETGTYDRDDKLVRNFFAQQANEYNQVNNTLGIDIQDAIA